MNFDQYITRASDLVGLERFDVEPVHGAFIVCTCHKGVESRFELSSSDDIIHALNTQAFYNRLQDAKKRLFTDNRSIV